MTVCVAFAFAGGVRGWASMLNVRLFINLASKRGRPAHCTKCSSRVWIAPRPQRHIGLKSIFSCHFAIKNSLRLPMSMPTHANCARALGHHMDSVRSQHFDLWRDAEYGPTHSPEHTPTAQHDTGASHSTRPHARSVPRHPLDPRTDYKCDPIRVRRYRGAQQSRSIARAVTCPGGRSTVI